MPVVEGTLTADGPSQEINSSEEYTLHLSGNFGGGTAQIQFQRLDGGWENYTTSKYTYTSADDVRMNERSKRKVRVMLSGATSPSLFYSFGYTRLNV